jgi:hypothetical protein
MAWIVFVPKLTMPHSYLFLLPNYQKSQDRVLVIIHMKRCMLLKSAKCLTSGVYSPPLTREIPLQNLHNLNHYHQNGKKSTGLFFPKVCRPHISSPARRSRIFGHNLKISVFDICLHEGWGCPIMKVIPKRDIPCKKLYFLLI